MFLSSVTYLDIVTNYLHLIIYQVLVSLDPGSDAALQQRAGAQEQLQLRGVEPEEGRFTSSLKAVSAQNAVCAGYASPSSSCSFLPMWNFYVQAVTCKLHANPSVCRILVTLSLAQENVGSVMVCVWVCIEAIRVHEVFFVFAWCHGFALRR